MIIRFVVIFLSFALLLIAIYAFPVVYKVYQNAALTESVPPNFVKWTGQEISDEEWRVKAHYSYTVNSKSYEKEEMLEGEKFRNPYLVETSIPALNERYKLVWYAARDPSNASIEKYFPLKRAIYSVMLFALFAYFITFGSIYTNYWLKKHGS